MATPGAGAIARAASPVHDVPGEEAPGPASRIALCLSGGGYRAMLFHAGSLRRLNELGWLSKLDRVSSVSGGSITAGLLGLRWSKLDFQAGVARRYDELVLEPLLKQADRTIDKKAVLLGFGPGSAGMRIAKAYRALFGDATLQELPDSPRFVYNATSLQSGVLRRFSKPYAWDYRIGKIEHPRFEIALAVAASSAFPPFLSPLVIDVPADAHVPGSGKDLEYPPYTTRLVLTDGGVYDNLGLETAWNGHRTILISDGGGRMKPEPKPKALWPQQSLRVLATIDNQVRSLRKRQAIDAFRGGLREGTYWGIGTEIDDYKLGDAMDAPPEKTRVLAEVKTRLASMPEVLRRQLVNWGYAVCDAAMRTHVDKSASRPAAFPYPEDGVG